MKRRSQPVIVSESSARCRYGNSKRNHHNQLLPNASLPHSNCRASIHRRVAKPPRRLPTRMQRRAPRNPMEVKDSAPRPIPARERRSGSIATTAALGPTPNTATMGVPAVAAAADREAAAATSQRPAAVAVGKPAASTPARLSIGFRTKSTADCRFRGSTRVRCSQTCTTCC